jgi:ABC-type branched-subunit amino acid transport system permease subunit
VWPLISGLLAVLAGQTLMHWYDPLGDGKFGTVATAVSKTRDISPLTSAYFGWLAWTELALVIVLCAVGVALRQRLAASIGAALAVLAAVFTWYAHHSVVATGGGIDHSLGWAAVVVGYLVIAFAGAIIAVSQAQSSAAHAFANRVLGWRPGLPLVVAGLVLGVLAFFVGRWFAPSSSQYNTDFGGLHGVFAPTALASWALAYLSWAGWALLPVAVLLAGVATYLRSRPLAWLAAAMGGAGAIYTLATVYEFSKVAAQVAPTFGSTWQNLGTGGWMACGAFLLLGGAGFVAATAEGHTEPAGEDAATIAPGAPPQIAKEARPTGFLSAPGAARSAVIATIAFALFYPPTATSFWQSVLVSEIGIYVLLAVGLNVVVGWAGLLDLGFIAFFAIGSYTTAYLTDSLPIHPPSWLVLPPLAAIPFAVVVCLIAGVLLGAPTLRLRGDYLAIVTLGFGEIIRIIANNADAITNGSRGTAVDPTRGVNNVPHPAIHVGPFHITWGLNQLQYWYLLLVLVIIVVVLFRRLENSRLGRAWAAIREDEVAAQATGMNTFRVKLLAFAIGASTSGLAGVFFGSYIGFFTPDNFVLNNSILVVAYVVFGGMGSLPGAMAGAALLTWLPEFLKNQVPAPDRQMWIGAVVLLMMIFRPAGLVPARRRRIELSADHLEEALSSETVAVPSGVGGAV